MPTREATQVSDAPILLLDNRDSFVWNLAQAFSMLGQKVTVTRSDEITVEEVAERSPKALVLSPGPGGPDDAGVCVAAVREASPQLPILGVCLGHQAVAAAFGGAIDRGAPCHGKAWSVAHERTGLFRGLPSPFRACRYHSLVVQPESLPAQLRADAWTSEGVVMAIRHTTRPVFGVQFHPESFRTEHGLHLLDNFLENCR